MRYVLSFIILLYSVPVAISETVVDPDCGISRDDIRAQLNEVSSIIIQRIDDVELTIKIAIQTAWNDYQGDSVVHEAIDNAREQIYIETEWLGRLSTIVNREKAEDIADLMTLYTFGNTPVRDLISSVTIQAQQEVQSIIETITVEVSEANLECLQQRTDRELPRLLAEAFVSRLDEMSQPERRSEIVPQIPSLDSSFQIVVVGTIGGIVARMMITELTESILRYALVRIPAKVIGKVIPYFGLILAAIDIRDAIQGFVPMIVDTLKREVGVQIRDGIGTEIRLVIGKELPMIASAVADDGYSTYLDFMDRWNDVISLATQSDRLSAFLNDDRDKDLAKIAELISALLVNIGREKTIGVIESGLFEKLYVLPKTSLQILEIKGPEETLAWFDLAVSDELLAQVVEKRIFMATSADQFESKEHLRDLLALDLELRDLRRIVMLPISHQQLLLELPIGDSREIITISREQDDLPWLLSFISDLRPNGVVKFVSRLKSDPSILDKIKTGEVEDILLKSPNFERHLDYVIHPDGPVVHTGRVITGDIPIGLVPSNDSRIWVGVLVGLVMFSALIISARWLLSKIPGIIQSIKNLNR